MIPEDIMALIRENSVDDGIKEFSPKPQYSRGGYLFKCPHCGFQTSSHGFLSLSYWEAAAATHLAEEHDLPKGFDWPKCRSCKKPIKDYNYQDEGQCFECAMRAVEQRTASHGMVVNEEDDY